MTNKDMARLIVLAAKDLEDAVNVYEKAKAEGQRERVWSGFHVPQYCSLEAIKHRITQLRHDLLHLEKTL